MANPWEKYQKAESGKPWERYQHAQQDEPESLWSDIKRGSEQLAENYITSLSGFAERLNNPGEAILHPELSAAGHLDAIHPYSDQIAAPKTITGSVVEALPTVAASIPGTNAAMADLETMTLPTLLKWAKKGMAMTIGGDISSGDQITPENLAAGTGANMLMEGVFHIPAGLKGVVSRIEGNNAEVLAAADRIGVPLTVGQVTRRPWLQSMEAAVNKLPGARAISDTYKKQRDILGQIIDRHAAELGKEASPNALGAEIKKATEQYLHNFKADSESLYDSVYSKIGKVRKINTTRFSDLLGQINGRFSGSGFEDLFDVPFIKKLTAGAKRAPGGVMANGRKQTVMQLRHARELIAEMSDAIGANAPAFKGMSDAQIERLRGALAEDIGQAFGAHGLGKEWDAVQGHYAAGRKLYEEALQSYDLTATADNLYKNIFGESGAGLKPINLTDAKALRATMPGGVWNKVRAEILSRMGEEGAGAAGAEGRKFSENTFMTNWTKLPADVRAELFGGELENTLEDVVKVSDALKANNLARNFSNTAHVAAITSWLTSTATALITGNPIAAVAFGAGTPLMGAGFGRLLTNPAAARALVDISTATDQPAIQKAVNRLAVILIAHPELARGIASDTVSQQQ